ncbi:MAG TPA: SRPBCC family protein [Gammaproteobacteria bacterium]|jgi:hypothetical protein
MFKIIAIIVLVLIAGVVIVAAMQPDTFRVQRSIDIKASPEAIFPYLNDFEKAMAWSPYEKKDPAMKRSFNGVTGGKGAVYEFEGNKEAGAGRIEILESVPYEKVTLQLDMFKPMKGSNTVEYLLNPKGDVTEVTWAMHGHAPFISKVVCLFFNMDKMVGGDFEKGLADLKSLVEAGAGS